MGLSLSVIIRSQAVLGLSMDVEVQDHDDMQLATATVPFIRVYCITVMGKSQIKSNHDVNHDNSQHFQTL